MDIKQQAYYARLTIGHGKPIDLSGPIARIFWEVQRLLMDATLRVDTDGNKHISLAINNQPMDDSINGDTHKQVQDLSAGLIVPDEPPTPEDGESPEDFMARLIERGTTEVAAKFVTASWFPEFTDSQLVRTMAWIKDYKAVRFRALNASQRLYDSAAPDEYKTLLVYCLHYFREFVESMDLKGK